MIPEIILIFAVTLQAAVLLSARMQRTLLSSSVVFLAVGFIVGNGGLRLLVISPGDPLLSGIIEIALASVLFADGMRLKPETVRSGWNLPGRALLLGMPLTFLIMAVLGKWLLGLPWLQAMLIAAVLSPTDPMFAALLVGAKIVPARLRSLLNLESGLNDGLALPVVMILLDMVAKGAPDLARFLIDVLVGVVIGIVVPLVALRLQRSRFFGVEAAYRPINGFSIGLLVLALAEVTQANAFLAMFCAGLMVAADGGDVHESYAEFGEVISELLKLTALFLFGMLLEPALFLESSVNMYVFAALVLLFARPAAILLSLLGSPLSRFERLTAAWFGPKGFSSIFYALLVWRRNIPDVALLLDVPALTIVCSIVAHSSTDILFTRWFTRRSEAGNAEPEPADT